MDTSTTVIDSKKIDMRLFSIYAHPAIENERFMGNLMRYLGKNLCSD